MKKINKIVNLISNIVLIIVILILVLYFVLRLTNKVEIYNVKTGSMEDRIHVGDYILIYKKSDYKVGDVVTFKKDDGFITHRIIKKDNTKFITKGDANNVPDEEILLDSIVGKVIIIGGILNTLIKYKYLLICIVLSLYLISCVLKEKGDKEVIV